MTKRPYRTSIDKKTGKQDVTMRDKNGKRKEQKQVLTMTVAEAHSLFVGENPTIVVGKSKFAEL